MKENTRPKALAEIRATFIEKGYPRLLVLTFLALSGLAAFGTSTTLLRFGVEHMGSRYLAATAIGYVVFLLLIRAWIEFSRPRRRDPRMPEPAVGDSSVDARSSRDGRGRIEPDRRLAHDVLSNLPVDVPFDDAWPAVVVVAVAAGVLLGGVVALFYVVYYAPVLLAEIALDAALVAGVYRRLRKQDSGYWLGSAIRHTWKPAVAIAACLFVVGVVVQWMMPAALTIGDVFR